MSFGSKASKQINKQRIWKRRTAVFLRQDGFLSYCGSGSVGSGEPKHVQLELGGWPPFRGLWVETTSAFWGAYRDHQWLVNKCISFPNASSGSFWSWCVCACACLSVCQHTYLCTLCEDVHVLCACCVWRPVGTPGIVAQPSCPVCVEMASHWPEAHPFHLASWPISPPTSWPCLPSTGIISKCLYTLLSMWLRGIKLRYSCFVASTWPASLTHVFTVNQYKGIALQ